MFRKFKPFEAPASFVFQDPDTGHILQAKGYTQLYTDIINYRKQNNLESLDELPTVVENYLCGLPENFHRCQPIVNTPGFMGYIKGGIYLLKNMLLQRFASQEVAEERALQCFTCPNNVFPDRDYFQKWSDEKAKGEVGDRKTSLHHDLGTCGACGCPLRSKVFVAGPLPRFKPAEAAMMRAVKCWQLPLSGQEGRKK